ncbi:MFS transporter [Streptomyces sp. NPDC050388]|uniref:MFS transporter n=1 Tax=Streptomyces sp. NPDC050388 TaxID=3155781 RepID=UPI0034498347
MRRTRAYYVGYGVSMLGSGMVLPITAIFLRSEVGLTIGQVSVYFALNAILGVLVNPFAGVACDRYGPKALVVPAVGLQVLTPLVLAVTQSFPTAVLAAVLSGVGNGVFYACLTPLISSLFGPEGVGRAFGNQYQIANIGYVVGAVASSGLVERMDSAGYRVAFVLNAVSFVVYGLLVVWMAEPVKTAGSAARRPSWNLRSSWSPYRDLRFLPLIAVQFCVVAFGLSQMESVLPLVLRDYGGFPIFAISLYIGINASVVLVLQTPVTRLVGNRWGPLRGLRTALAVWGVSIVFGILSLYLDATVAKFVALAVFALLGAVGEALVAPSMQPLVVERAPKDRLGAYSASISLGHGFAAAAAPLLCMAVLGGLGTPGYWALLGAGYGLGLLSLRLYARTAAPGTPSPAPPDGR